MTPPAIRNRDRRTLSRRLRMAGTGLSAAIVLCLATVLLAQQAPATAVNVVLLDGTRITGSLQRMDQRQIQLDGAAARHFDYDEVLAIELPEPALSLPPPATLEFANGDRISVEVAATEDDYLQAHWHGTPLGVPLAELRGVLFRPIDAEGSLAGLMFRESGSDDLVLLSNGDHLAGRFVALAGQELVLETEGRELRVPRNRLTAVAFSPELIAGDRQISRRQIVETTSGSLSVRDLSRREDGSWQAQSLFGESIVLPVGVVRRVLFASDNTVFLSDLEPSAVEFTPYLDTTWPLRTDRAVTGEPLSVAGRNYAKGIGVHSRCRVSYNLAGEYAALHAVAGLAESAGEIGSVEFAIELDGREVVRTGPVSLRDPAVPINNLDLGGVETLVLTVDFGRNGDIRDRANWCDAILVKK